MIRLSAVIVAATLPLAALAEGTIEPAERNMQIVLDILDRDFGLTPSEMLFSEPCDPSRDPGKSYCQVRVNDMQVRAYGSTVSVLSSSTRTVEDVGILCSQVLHALVPSLGPNVAMGAMIASVERAAAAPDRWAKSEIADITVTVDIGETAFDCDFLVPNY